MHTNANTPIIIGAGQAVEHLRSDLNTASSAQTLASIAAKNAIQDTNVSDLSEHIDVIAATRTFFDSVPLWPAPFGKSNNLPGSIAKLIGATPKHLVYASVGGQSPQSLINEWFEKLAKGQASVVLLAGAEVIASTNNALKAGTTPDWSDTINTPFEDRELDIDDLVDEHLLQHLVMSMPINYGLCEMARLHQSGLSIDQYRLQMAKQLAPMSAIADSNQYAMFKGTHDATQLANLEGRNGYVALPYPKADRKSVV